MSSDDSSLGSVPRRSDRIAGCLVGLAVGDALGAPLEFLSRREVRKRYPEGLRDMIDSHVDRMTTIVPFLTSYALQANVVQIRGSRTSLPYLHPE